MPALTNVIPNETWQLALEFEGQEIRLFDASIARAEKNWPELAYPHKLKNLTFDARQVCWPGDRVLDAERAHHLAERADLGGEHEQAEQEEARDWSHDEVGTETRLRA